MNSSKKNFKILGASAINDYGFQFYLIIHFGIKIEKLIEELKTLSDCMETHKAWKKEPWYNNKTTVKLNDDIEGYKIFSQLTYGMAKKIYDERKKMYDMLIEIVETSLEMANEKYLEDPTKEFLRPSNNDIERLSVIVNYSKE